MAGKSAMRHAAGTIISGNVYIDSPPITATVEVFRANMTRCNKEFRVDTRAARVKEGEIGS